MTNAIPPSQRNFIGSGSDRLSLEEDQLISMFETMAVGAVGAVPEVGALLGPLLDIMIKLFGGGDDTGKKIAQYVERYVSHALLEQSVREKKAMIEGFASALADVYSRKDQSEINALLRSTEVSVTREMAGVNFHEFSTPTADTNVKARDNLMLFAALAHFHLNLIEELSMVEEKPDSRASYKERFEARKEAYASHVITEMNRAVDERVQEIDSDTSMVSCWVTDDFFGRSKELGDEDMNAAQHSGDRYRHAVERTTARFFLLNAVATLVRTSETLNTKQVLKNRLNERFSSFPDKYDMVRIPGSRSVNDYYSNGQFAAITTDSYDIAYDSNTGEVLFSYGHYTDDDGYDIHQPKRISQGWDSIAFGGMVLALYYRKEGRVDFHKFHTHEIFGDYLGTLTTAKDGAYVERHGYKDSNNFSIIGWNGEVTKFSRKDARN